MAARRTDESTARFLRSVANDVATQPGTLLRDGLTQAGWTLPPPAAAKK